MSDREEALNDLRMIKESFSKISAYIDEQPYRVRYNKEISVMKELVDNSLSRLALPIKVLSQPEQKPIIIKESIYNRKRL